MVFLSACTQNVRVEETFPDVVAEPRDLSVVLVMNQAFRTHQAYPTSQTTIQLGTAQVEAMSKAFGGLFSHVTVVESRDQVNPGADMVVTPSVQEVQLSTPSESYLNVYEVWIKYRLVIESPDGSPIDTWFLPAYGKTPYSAMLSRTRAIELATVVALRDISAKLVLDFFRIPAVNGWMRERESMEAAP